MYEINSTACDLTCDYIGFRIIFTVFKMMGLAPFTVRRSASRGLRRKCAWQKAPTVHFSTSRFGRVCNLCLVPIQMCVLIYTVPYSRDEYYPNKTAITAAADMASCVFSHIALFGIWLILGFRQKTTVRLLNRLFSFDCTTLLSNPTDETAEFSSRYFFLTFAIYIIITVGALYSDQLAFGFLVVSYIMTGGPGIIIAWFIAQYGFVVKLIGNRIEAFNRTLKHCKVSSPPDLALRSFVVQDLNWKSIPEPNIADLRRAHMDIIRIASEIADFYSIPILLAVANQCYSFIYYWHYFIISLDLEKEAVPGIEIVDGLFWISTAIVPVAILAASVTNVTKESRKTCDDVKKLLSHSNNSPDADIELNRFLLQLLHQDLRFTACGLFSLDLTLVHSIIRTMVRYVVVLLHFQPRFDRDSL